MTVGFGEHPAVARRRVRLALRKARQSAEFHQGDVADRLGWSLSKVQRIEAGEVAVSITDLRALVELYGGFSTDQIDELLEDARISRRQRWWTAPEYREHLTPATIKLMGFEAEAAAIWAYQPVLLPGLLQTSTVAGEILRFWSVVDEERVRVRHEVRMLRRKQVIEREDAPSYHVVLDESVLLRDIGGPKLAVEQMEALVEDAQRPEVHIRVLPLPDGAVLGQLGPFTILDLNEHDPDDAVLYRERWDGDEVIDDLKIIRQHRDYARRLQHAALSEEVSLRMIIAKAAGLRSEVDRSDSRRPL